MATVVVTVEMSMLSGPPDADLRFASRAVASVLRDLYGASGAMMGGGGPGAPVETRHRYSADDVRRVVTQQRPAYPTVPGDWDLRDRAYRDRIEFVLAPTADAERVASKLVGLSTPTGTVRSARVDPEPGLPGDGWLRALPTASVRPPPAMPAQAWLDAGVPWGHGVRALRASAPAEPASWGEGVTIGVFELGQPPVGGAPWPYQPVEASGAFLPGADKVEHVLNTLGVLVADGVTQIPDAGGVATTIEGVAPRARVRLFGPLPIAGGAMGPEATVADCVRGLRAAIDALAAGDVLLVELEFKDTDGSNRARLVERDPELWHAVADAVGKGIVVITPAGNHAASVDTVYGATNAPLPDSGSVVVTGVEPPTDTGVNVRFNRIVDCGFGARVDVASWADGVLSLKQDGGAWVSDVYAGSSSASAIVAGLTAIVIAHARAMDLRVTPEDVRRWLREPSTAHAAIDPTAAEVAVPSVDRIVERLRGGGGPI